MTTIKQTAAQTTLPARGEGRAMSTTRKTAIGLVEELNRIPDVNIAMCCEKDVIEAIDKALRDRDADVALKVLTAARDRALSYDGISGERTGANGVRFAIQEALTECGVGLEALSEKGTK